MARRSHSRQRLGRSGELRLCATARAEPAEHARELDGQDPEQAAAPALFVSCATSDARNASTPIETVSSGSGAPS
jgi:hypothetical protein